MCVNQKLFSYHYKYKLRINNIYANIPPCRPYICVYCALYNFVLYFAASRPARHMWDDVFQLYTDNAPVNKAEKNSHRTKEFIHYCGRTGQTTISYRSCDWGGKV